MNMRKLLTTFENVCSLICNNILGFKIFQIYSIMSSKTEFQPSFNEGEIWGVEIKGRTAQTIMQLLQLLAKLIVNYYIICAHILSTFENVTLLH